MKKIIVGVLLCAMVMGGAFAAARSDSAGTDNYPSRPVKCLVTWAAGGGADLVMRAIAEVFPKYANGQPLVIENKPEASGVPGTFEYKQNAKPDGYEIMQWNPATVIKTHMDPVPFTGTEFKFVCQLVLTNIYLTVPANGKWKTIQEYVADAKANPGQITVGNAGTGGGNHFAALLFEKAAGIQLRHVPFSGGGPAITGMLTGDCQSVMANPPDGGPNVEAGQIIVLASFGDKRNPTFPNAPTGKEAGVNFAIDFWRGVVVPAGTPDAIVQKLESILKQCVEDTLFIQRMQSLGAIPEFADAKTYGDKVAADDKIYEALVKENKLGNRY